ncbi:hypothetical protein CR513_13949, partial [Mucuna pruriens]
MQRHGMRISIISLSLLRESKVVKERLESDAKYYIWDDPYLWICNDQVTHRCILEFEIKSVLHFCYSATEEGHYGSMRTAWKVLDYGLLIGAFFSLNAENTKYAKCQLALSQGGSDSTSMEADPTRSWLSVDSDAIVSDWTRSWTKIFSWSDVAVELGSERVLAGSTFGSHIPLLSCWAEAPVWFESASLGPRRCAIRRCRFHQGDALYLAHYWYWTFMENFDLVPVDLERAIKHQMISAHQAESRPRRNHPGQTDSLLDWSTLQSSSPKEQATQSSSPIRRPSPGAPNTTPSNSTTTSFLEEAFCARRIIRRRYLSRSRRCRSRTERPKVVRGDRLACHRTLVDLILKILAIDGEPSSFFHATKTPLFPAFQSKSESSPTMSRPPKPRYGYLVGGDSDWRWKAFFTSSNDGGGHNNHHRNSQNSSNEGFFKEFNIELKFLDKENIQV